MVFWVIDSLLFLADKHLNYIIAVKINPILKMEILTLKEWLSIDEGIQIGELSYKAHWWHKVRRIIVIRQSVLKKT